jgi:hypothetical protein
MQKGLYEYARARAGHYAKVLFREPGFQAAVEQSRWRAYPLGLAMVAELVEGMLRPYGTDRQRQLDALSGLVLSVFDRYPVPPSLGEQAWSEARVELARRVQLAGMHAPSGPSTSASLGRKPISISCRSTRSCADTTSRPSAIISE